MKNLSQTALVKKHEEGFTVHSPLVGMAQNFPSEGTLLAPGSLIGRIQVISRLYNIYLPGNISGRVGKLSTRDKVRALDYQEKIFDLSPLGSIEESDASVGEVSLSSKASDGCYEIKSPTDGMFYEKPSPDAAPYIQEGMVISQGKIVGLVEVMKTFNQIFFDDAYAPKKAKVVEICVGDATEITSGQTLFRLEAVE